MAKTVYQIAMQDEVTAVLRNIEKGLERVTQQTQAMAQIKGLEVMGQIFDGLKNGVTASITAYADAQRESTKLNAVLAATGNTTGFTTAQLDQMASSMQKLTGIDGDLVKGGMAILSTFKSISGEGFKRTLDVAADLSGVLGLDLNSTIRQLGKSLESPVEGMTQLRRVGVVFSDAQEEVIKKMVASGDAAGAQKAMLTELERAYGGAAKAMRNDLKGSLNELAGAAGDVTEVIGKGLAPTVQGITEILSGMLRAAEQIPAPIMGGVTAMAALTAGIPLAVTAIKSAQAAIKALGVEFSASTGLIGLAVGAVVGIVVGLTSAIAEEEARKRDMVKTNAELISSYANTKAQAAALREEMGKQNQASMVTQDQVDRLVQLYPELTNRIYANTTTVKEAMRIEKEAAQAKKESVKQTIEATIAETNRDLANTSRALAERMKEYRAKFGENENYYNRNIKSLEIRLKEATKEADKKEIKASIERNRAALEELRGRKGIIITDLEKQEAELKTKVNQLQQQLESYNAGLSIGTSTSTAGGKPSIDNLKTYGKILEGIQEKEKERLRIIEGAADALLRFGGQGQVAKVLIEAGYLDEDQKLLFERAFANKKIPEKEIKLKLAETTKEIDNYLKWGTYGIDPIEMWIKPTLKADEDLNLESLYEGLDLNLDTDLSILNELELKTKNVKNWLEEAAAALQKFGQSDEWQFAQSALSQTMSIFSSINDIIMSGEKARHDEAMAHYAKELEELDSSYNAQKQLKEDLGESTTEIDKQYAKDKAAIENQKRIKENEYNKKAFENNKAMGTANALISGGVAFVNALASSPPPYNFIMAGLVGAATGLQVAAIQSQQFVPQLADGGIVKARPGGTLVNISEAGYDEAVIPLKNGFKMGGDTFNFYITGMLYGDINQFVDEIKKQMDKQVRRGVA